MQPAQAPIPCVASFSLSSHFSGKPRGELNATSPAPAHKDDHATRSSPHPLCSASHILPHGNPGAS